MSRAQSDAEAGDPEGEPGPILERLEGLVAKAEGLVVEARAKRLKGFAAEGERRVAEAHAQADERIEQLRRESEERIQEERRKSEERLEAERRAAQARIHDAERLVKRAEERAATLEDKLNRNGLRPRAGRKLDATRQAQEEELRRTHAAERAQLDERVAKLEARTKELETTLERERADTTRRVAEFEQRIEEAGAEHAREHAYRRELEERMVAELASGEEVQGQLETERAERQRLEQRLSTLPQGVADTRTAGEQETVESEQVLQAVETSGNGQPPAAADEARPDESSGERARRSRPWRRRSTLPCAVCHRTRPAVSNAELAESGWALSGAGALCASCQQDGWQLPAGATVPFRSRRPA